MSNPAMLIDDIRRNKLAALAASMGGVSGLSRLLDRSESQISQWINGSQLPSGKKRGMRSDTARWIERKAGKPEGWLDTIEAPEQIGRPNMQRVRRLAELVSEDGLGIVLEMLEVLAASKPHQKAQQGHLDHDLDSPKQKTG